MKHLHVNGGSIEYEWVGAAKPESPLVFLHEGLGSATMWGRFPGALAAATGRRGLVYSRLGYGRSDAPARPWDDRFLHHEALGVLPELLEHLGVRSPVLVGHSDGASIALIHAAAHPTSVAALVLEAPHVFAEPLAVNGVARIRARFAGDAEFRRRLGRYHRDAEEVVRRWSDAWLAPAFSGWSIEEGLSQIICPVLLLQAEHDPYGSPEHLERIAGRAQGPVRTVMLPGSSHAPHRDWSDRVVREASHFLAGLGGTT